MRNDLEELAQQMERDKELDQLVTRAFSERLQVEQDAGGPRPALGALVDAAAKVDRGLAEILGPPLFDAKIWHFNVCQPTVAAEAALRFLVLRAQREEEDR